MKSEYPIACMLVIYQNAKINLFETKHCSKWANSVSYIMSRSINANYQVQSDIPFFLP